MAYTRCIKCGEKIPKRKEFCPYCHTKQRPTIRYEIGGFIVGIFFTYILVALIFAWI